MFYAALQKFLSLKYPGFGDLALLTEAVSRGFENVCFHLQTTTLPSYTPIPLYKEETPRWNSSQYDPPCL